MNRKNKNTEIAKIILKCIAVSGIAVTIVALPGMAQVLNMFMKNDKKYRFRSTLYRLKSKKMVTMYYKDNEEVVEITEKGKKRLLKYEFNEMKIKIPKRWDGLWRIVIFDIPEKRKKVRNAINLKLKELGFYPIQKSTFIFPYECRNEIDFVAEHFFARKYINYIVAKEIDDSKKLKKFFKI